MSWKIALPFYSPDDNNTSALDILTKDIDDSDDDDKDEEVTEEDEDEGEGEEDLSDEGEDKDEEDEKDEDEEEDKEKLVRVTYQDLKAAFKDKPAVLNEVKKAFYREQEFSKVFDSPQEAADAAKDAERFKELNDTLLSGDSEAILKGIEEANPKAFKNFVSNVADTIRKIDNDTYLKEIATPVIQRVLAEINTWAEKKDNDDVKAAAKLINKLLFDSEDIKAPASKVDKTDKEKELDDKEKKWLDTKHSEYLQDVYPKAINKLESEIEKDLDPTNVLKNKPKLKARMLKAVKDEVLESLEKDEAHISRIQRLLKEERRTGYSGQLKERIINAFLSRAQALIPGIRKEVRSEFLGEAKAKDERQREAVNGRKKNLDAGGATRKGVKVLTVKEAKDKKLTELQLVAGDF